MARRKSLLSEAEKKLVYDERLKLKLASLKANFESGRVENFKQVEALIPYSVMANLLHMGSITYKNKCNSPGDFSLTELVQFASIVDVKLQLVIDFFLKVVI